MITYRIATIDDTEELLSIYSYYVEHTVITFEYEKPTLEEFYKRIELTLKEYPYLVCEEDGEIIGFAYASRHMIRAAYAWNATLTVYLKQGKTGKGIGQELYKKLIDILTKQNVVNFYGCISKGNGKSIKMHENMGFHTIALFEKTGFKNGQWHDVVWMEKSINQGNAPKEFIPFSQMDNINI